jgi:crotonobetainyl-CoA:carnitine CoA-transferase CaiB-like acyl-CoA transferase
MIIAILKRTDWPGGDVGSHTESVLQSLLGLDSAAIAQLRRNGVV